MNNSNDTYNDDDDDDYVDEYCDIVIVGAGVAGTSTLHHLLPYHKDIVILDAGSAPGQGFDETSSRNATVDCTRPNIPHHQHDIRPRYSGTAVFIDHHENVNTLTSTLNENDESHPHSIESTCPSRISPGTSQEDRIIKMMVQIFACSTDTFISHHGVHGAQIYLQCTRQGLIIQKRLAKELLLDMTDGEHSTNVILHELGSIYLAYKDDVDELRKEYNQYISLGTDLFDDNGIEWYEVTNEDEVGGTSVLYNPDQSRSIVLSEQNPFHGAIYFPNDAIIDSSQYSKQLLNHAVSLNNSKNTQSHVSSRMNTIVTHIERLSQIHPWNDSSTTDQIDETTTNSRQMYGAIVTCYDTKTQRRHRIYCRHVIVAIGGLSVPRGCCIEDLYGIIRPCYSYLAHVPMKNPMVCQLVNKKATTEDEHASYGNRLVQRSPNFFTWNFTHDWCYTDPYHIRVSGEDHYSARKDPRQPQRCENLIRWTYEQYQRNDKNGNIEIETIPQQSGIYTETPDCAPVVGSIASDKDNTICYIVGCNAWGQAILSHAATLVPPLLGLRPMTDTEHDAMKVLSIQRFTHSIAVPMRPCVPSYNVSSKK